MFSFITLECESSHELVPSWKPIGTLDSDFHPATYELSAEMKILIRQIPSEEPNLIGMNGFNANILRRVNIVATTCFKLWVISTRMSKSNANAHLRAKTIISSV